MNDLVVSNDSGVEQTLGTASLEEIRNKAFRNIESNPILTDYQKNTIIKELDFLIEHERLRRLRKFAFQWAEEKEVFQNGMLLRRIELDNGIRVSRKQTALKIAQLNKDILDCKLDVIERIRKLRPKDDSAAYLKKAALELQKLRFQKIIMKAKEDMFHQNLTDRALSRQRFYEKVKKLYPDMADDLMEYYDRQVFQQIARR
jgi:hypothetical protein